AGRAQPASTRAGAALFWCSDALLGLRMFVLGGPPSALDSAVMATYCAGQYGLTRAP
uniref:lysoplasmalogenase family protein n=1 Tax=Piscicoccus intestinalis TaxID=746033 RepID=UPI001C3F4584